MMRNYSFIDMLVVTFARLINWTIIQFNDMLVGAWIQWNIQVKIRIIQL